MYKIDSINKSKLISSHFPNMETASVGVFLNIGSRYEKKDVKGIAHFLEHMLFKGSKKYSYRQVKREIEGRGGVLNGFTSQEITGYYANFLNKNLANVLDILVDIVLNPLLKVEDIDKEREVILQEVKMYNDLPSSRVVMLLDELLWEGHPLGEDILGYDFTINKMNRTDLINFRDKHYTPSNMLISFSGAYSREKIIDLLDKKIMKTGSHVKLDFVKPDNCRGIKIKVEKKPLEQTHLCIGFRSISSLSKDRLTGQLINIVLGANMSSRLFEELREKKSLCYDIGTELRKYKDSGAFIIHTGLDKNKIYIAITTILKELNKLKEKEISLRELSRAKDYLLGQVAMGLERPQGMMFYLAENYLTLGKIEEFKDIKNQVASITPEKIKKLANEIFNFKNICISCIGDIENGIEDKIKKILGNI